MTRPNARPALLALALGAAAAGPVAAQEAPGAAQAAEHYAGIAADADVSLVEPLVQPRTTCAALLVGCLKERAATSAWS